MDILKYTFQLFLLFMLPASPAFSQEFRMGEDTNITTCGGFFLDSGGAEGAYGPNESHVVTICSDQSQGSHIQMIFSSPNLSSGDNLCFFDGTDINAPLLSCAADFTVGSPFIIQATAANPSGCITIAFESDDAGQGAGWSADLNCVTACQIIQADLIETVPAISPVDTGYMDTCPGETISFKAAGRYPQNGIAYQHSDATARFNWNFGDGNSAVGPEVSHSYDKPGGYTVQLTITDQFGCQSTNFISQRVRISTKPDFMIGGDLPSEICVGDTVELNAIASSIDTSKVLSVVPTEGSFQFGGVRSDSLPLPDGTGAAYETSVKFTSFQPGQVLTDIQDLLSICVNIEHSWMRDLEISLSCPDGTSVLLHDHAGQTGGSVFLGIPIDNDDFSIRPGTGFDYCWTPNATNPDWLTYANSVFPTTLPAGDYQSYESLEKLEGCPLNGEWTIRVQDLWGQDNGFIFSWGINFSPDLFPNLETFTPQIVDSGWEPALYTIFSEKDTLATVPRNAGKTHFIYTVTDDFGCTYDSTVTVKILPPTDPNCYSCEELLQPAPDTAICEGESASFNVAGQNSQIQEITFENSPRYALGFSNHPPGNPYVSSMEIGGVLPNVLTDPANQIISVCLDVETDWTGDLRMTLRAPSGATMVLSDGNGDDGDNFTNTCFTPGATTSIASGSAPFTGEFRPEGDWNALRNSPIEGEWALLVSDALGAEEMGRINSWSITFRSSSEVTYRWTPTAGLSCSDCPDPVATPDATTIYLVEASDSYGCSSLDTIIVGIPSDEPLPEVSCTVGDDATITWFWTPGSDDDQFETRILRDDRPEPWDFRGNDNRFILNDAQRRQEVTLELRYYIGGDPVNCSIPVSSASCIYMPCDLELSSVSDPQPVSCPGDTDGVISVAASGGDEPYEFFIDGSATPQPTGVFSGLAGGDHLIVVADTSNCLDSLVVSVGEPDTIAVSLKQIAQSCPGETDNQVTATPSGGNGGYAYLWNNGQNTATAVNLDSLVYSVTVTDVKGCTGTAGLKVDDLPSFNPNVIQSIPSCYGYPDGQLAVNLIEGGLSQDPADYSFRWSTGQTGALIGGLLGDQVYSVTVTSREGCAVITERTLRQPQQITFDIEEEPILCATSPTGAATVTNIQGRNQDFTIQWDDRAGNGNTARVDSLSQGTYSVTVTDEDGCFNTGSITLVEPPALNVAIQTEDNLCFGDQDGQIQLSVTGGTPDYRFSWSTGAITGSIDSLPAGSYSYTVTDGNGCIWTQTVAIDHPPALQGELQPVDPTCSDFLDGFIGITPSGGVPPYLFSMDNQNFGKGGQFAGLGAGGYQVYIKDNNGCLFFETVTLTDPPEFTVNAGPDLFIALGDSVALNGTSINGVSGVEYVWTAPYDGTLSCSECQTVISNTFNTITYELYGIDGRGCEATDFVTVNVEKIRMVDVPTGFTPNDDGINDLLLVHGKEGTRIKMFRVFDRWGELVFETGDFMVNDPQTGWDGTYRGQALNSGVFIWYVEVEYLDGAEDVFKGQSTLIR